MKRTLASYIKIDPHASGPFVLVRIATYMHALLYEVRGKGGNQCSSWYTSFNGNSKQRRQQQRKLLRDLNQG